MSDQTIKANSIDIWYETFGDKKNPAFLLMMGNGCDALMWPDQFCQNLASNGYLVIRFDQRDTGESTHFDFNKNPYTLFDMASDALGLLDALEIPKAHIVGFSTGGAIAQLLTLQYPQRVLSLALLMTGMDLTIKNDAFAGKDMSNAAYPPPKKEFIESVLALNSKPITNDHEKIVRIIENLRLANGNKAYFDEQFFYDLLQKSQQRTHKREKHSSKIGHASNHGLATSATQPVSSSQLRAITIPTFIIAGEQDPIFPTAHSQALAKTIPNSQLLIITEMGHVLTPVFFNQIVQALTNHAA